MTSGNDPLPIRPLGDQELQRERFLQNASSEGIVTLAGEDFFVGLVLLYHSVQLAYPVPILCFDGGLTDVQIDWARQHMPNCTIQPIPNTEDIRRVRETLSGTSVHSTEEWLVWVCPMLIAASPFRRTLWLDCDLVVLGELGSLFQLIDDGPVFTPENHDPSTTANSPELYEALPVGRSSDLGTTMINGGVSGWDIERDADLLELYSHPVKQATRDPRVRDGISWYDQGALIWAVQKGGVEHRIVDTEAWNLCALWSDDPEKQYQPDAELLDTLRSDYPDTHIVHWNGFSVPTKLASRLGAESTVLESLRRLLPGHSKGARKRKGQIKLISHIGCKSDPLLIDHFLDHYTQLGVDEFLIVLQGAEDDPRLADARALFEERDIQPVLEPVEYSERLKYQRTLDLQSRHWEAEDWVLYVDIDELQVYPEELPLLLERCDDQGYTFLRGQFVDRVAEGGELPAIKPEGSLWEQFPFGASVTAQITGGWDRKVCAAKGAMPIADGGSHGLNYGLDDVDRNYATTHRDPNAYPTPVEIHHFKWEASLIRRTEEKTACVGGDRDAIDGKHFIHEYHGLLSHLNQHGRLNVEGIRYIGEPQLNYVRGLPRRRG